MADDSFIREVNEELRQDQAKALWNRYGIALVAAAVAIVLATAAYVGWEYWARTQANASGDRFSAALQLANSGRADEALNALAALEKEGYGAYPVLARMRSATVLSTKGEWAAAVAEFDEVSGDGSVPDSIRDLARMRAALILVDNGTYDEVSARVEALASEANPLRHSAREALGLAAWKAGRAKDALALFDQIASDEDAPRNLRQQATMMSELIRGSGATS